MNVALCFCVRDCGIYLPYIFKNIELLKTLNYNIYSIFVYDNCVDDSEKQLINYKNKNKDYVIIENIKNNSKLRTERIAKARNACLNIVYKLENISYHIMADCDNVGAPKWNIDIINKYLNNFDGDNWDCISFNKRHYYDIWALLYDDFKHNCWGFGKDSINVIMNMRGYIMYKLQNAKSNSIEVISAFNGFCIYKTERFKGFYYDGLYDNFKSLITEHERNNTIKAFKKLNLNVKCFDKTNVPDSDPREHCEHLFYHVSAHKKGRKIKISKFIIN